MLFLGAILTAAAVNRTALARQDLAGRLQIDAGKITVVSQKETVWPDGSLGCPQPGMSYIQMQVPGFIIEFSAAGKRYTYHADQRHVMHCDESIKVAPRKRAKAGAKPV